MFDIRRSLHTTTWYVTFRGECCSAWFSKFEDAVIEKRRLEKLYNG